MEWVASFLLVFLVVSCVLQLFWAHSLSVIARKTGQNDLMQTIAWIPLLQIAPLLSAGGGSVLHFIAAAIALTVGNVVLLGVGAFLGNAFGNAIAGLGIALTSIILIVYFGRLAWRTAVARDLSGWIGLLLFVPLVNVFIYPFMAFHDGWVGPHKIGLVFGVIITVASTAPSFLMVGLVADGGKGLPGELAFLAAQPELSDIETLQALAAEMQTFSTAADPNTAGPVPNGLADENTRQQGLSIQALYALQNRFNRLEEFTAATTTPMREEERLEMLDLLGTTRTELETYRGALDDEAFEDLGRHLVQIEASLHTPSALAQENPIVPSAANPGSTWARPQTGPGPAALASLDEETAPPIRPLPVQANADCLEGTALRTQTTEHGEEEWCQQLPQHGGLRHGWYARYFSDGRTESMGEYRDGLRVGVWTRFHPSGTVRAQAEFRDGLQHGWLLSFDPAGARTKAIRFEAGARAR